ncbi:trichohyalin-like [Engraulis encrasicolus]|uniref:trichohyalin-like n=1 Tax=Engraulis encrasicolus TaxID=184585 RepID=UPI002FD5C123
MKDWAQSAQWTDTRPFSQILSGGTQDNSDLTLSVAGPRTSRKGKKGGSGRARAYVDIPKEPDYDNLPKPKQAMNKKQRDHMARKRQLRDCSQARNGLAQGQQRAGISNTVNAVDIPLQYQSDSGEETPTCWFFIVKLCRCCAKRLFKRRATREREEERLRELRLLEEEKLKELQRKFQEAKELQRKFQEIKKREKRRLEEAAMKFEMRRKGEEEAKKEQQLLQQQVVQDKTSDQWNCGLTKEEMEELEMLKQLEKSLSLQILGLEQWQAGYEERTATAKKEQQLLPGLQQWQGMPAPLTSSTDDEVMERQHLRTKHQQMTSREIERMADMARKRENEKQDEWSGSVEDESVELELNWQYQLKLQRNAAEMEHRFDLKRNVLLNRHKETMRELDNQWQLQYNAKKKEMEQYQERRREMAKRREEELSRLIEQQQNIKREADNWKVKKCRIAEPKPQRQSNGETTMREQLENAVHRAKNEHQKQTRSDQEKLHKMKEQLMSMRQRFEKGKKMVEERYEKRWKRMEEERQKEWDERVLELNRRLGQERQKQEVLKMHKEHNIPKEALTRMKIPSKPGRKETTMVEETDEETELEKVVLKPHITKKTLSRVEIPSNPEKKGTMMENISKMEQNIMKDSHTETAEDRKLDKLVLKLHKEQDIAKEALTQKQIPSEPEQKEVTMEEDTDDERKLDKLVPHKEQNIRKEALTQTEIPPKPDKTEIMMENISKMEQNTAKDSVTLAEIEVEQTETTMVEETDEERELEKVVNSECVEEIGHNVDKRDHKEVDFQDGQNTLEDHQSSMKDNRIQKEQNNSTEYEVENDKRMECLKETRQDIIYKADLLKLTKKSQ